MRAFWLLVAADEKSTIELFERSPVDSAQRLVNRLDERRVGDTVLADCAARRQAGRSDRPGSIA